MTTLAQISSEIEVATKRSDLTAEIVVCVQRALEEAADEWEWKELQDMTTYALSASVASVALTTLVPEGAMEKIRALWYEKSADNSIWPLRPLSLDEFKATWGYSVLSGSRGTPVDYMEDSGSVHFGPVPDAAATIRIFYKKVIPAAGDILLRARQLVKLKAYQILYLEYLDMPEQAAKYELWYQAALTKAIAKQPRGDEVTVVKYRDL